ncbi:MAG TPA: hypothetical protein VFY39_03305 [Gammaproteobacteria bacterium]|nr:hypothetical protein [Gammaproteobacteria bacterium]
MHAIAKPALFGARWAGAGLPTIGALMHWIERLFFLPGDWLVWAVVAHAPRAAAFLGLSASDYGGVLSGFVSAMAWLAGCFVAATIYTAVIDLDRALTQRVRRLYHDSRARLRIAVRLTDYRLRHPRRLDRQRPRIEPVLELSEEFDVSIAELKVLHAHLNLKPGFSLSISEIAAAVGARKTDLQRLLPRLEQLNLLRAAPSGVKGEKAYVLTPAGRAFLVFRQMSSRAGRRADSGSLSRGEDRPRVVVERRRR